MGATTPIVRRFTLTMALVATGFAVSSPAAAPVFALGECGVSDALQNVFVGANNGSWTVSSNWSENQLPADGNICVPAGKTVLVPGGTSMVNHAVGQFATLRIAGTVRLADDSAAVTFASIYGGTDMTISGRLEVTDGVTFNLNPDQNGAPAFQVTAGAVVAVSKGAVARLTRALVNRGTISLATGGSFSVDTGGAYSGSGNVTGGRLLVRGGTVTFGSAGVTRASVRSGTVLGTINANSTLDMRCETSSTAPSIDGVTNRGTVEILPPVTGVCSINQSLSAGTTFRNDGTMIVGSRSRHLGWSYYGSNVFDQGGTFVNTGTLRIEDHWSANFGAFTNSGRIEVGRKGVFERVGVPTTNTGRIVARGSIDLTNVDNRGLLDLYRATAFRGVLTLGARSKLTLHASRGALPGITSLSTGSTLDGTLTVMTGQRKPGRGWRKPAIAPRSNVTGRFDTVKGLIPGTSNRYKVVYGASSVDLQVVAR